MLEIEKRHRFSASWRRSDLLAIQKDCFSTFRADRNDE
jgi:hypothetical protein